MSDADRQFVIALRNGFDVDIRRMFLHRAINNRHDIIHHTVPYRRRMYGPLFIEWKDLEEMKEFMRAKPVQSTT